MQWPGTAGLKFSTPTEAGVRISMDGKDNVMVERLWRSLKYECIYLHAFETGSELRQGLSDWITFYNSHRPHTRLDDRTPDEAYYNLPLPGYTGTGIKKAA